MAAAARDRLRQFYGLGDIGTDSDSTNVVRLNTSPSSIVATSRVEPVDNLDIDSAHFDIKKYLDASVNGKEVIDLMRMDNDLVSESLILDGKVRALIYDNFASLVHASETIGGINKSIKNMNQATVQLASTRGTYECSSQVIKSKLSPVAQNIARMINVEDVVRKLELIFALPRRLQEFKDAGQIDQAISYYLKCKGLLQRYRETDVFLGIETSARPILAEVGKHARSAFEDPQTSIEQANVCCRCLVALDVKDLSKVSSDFLRMQRERFAISTFAPAQYVSKVDRVISTYESLFQSKNSSPSPKTKSASDPDLQEFASWAFGDMCQRCQESDFSNVQAIIEKLATVKQFGWLEQFVAFSRQSWKELIQSESLKCAEQIVSKFESARGYPEYLPNVALDACDLCRDIVAGPYLALSRKLRSYKVSDGHLTSFIDNLLDSFDGIEISEKEDAAVCLAFANFLESGIVEELSTVFEEPVSLDGRSQNVVLMFIRSVGGLISREACNGILAARNWPLQGESPSDFVLWLERELNGVINLVHEAVGAETDASFQDGQEAENFGAVGSRDANQGETVSSSYYYMMQNFDRMFSAGSVPVYYEKAELSVSIVYQIQAVVLRSIVEAVRARVRIVSNADGVRSDMEYLQRAWKRPGTPKYVTSLLDEVAFTLLQKGAQ